MTTADLQKLPDPPQTLPVWVQSEIANTQAMTDREYVDKVNNFLDQSASWIQTQTLKRGSNATYAPDPFAIKIPLRYSVSADEFGTAMLTPMAADPNLHMPVLPSLTTPIVVAPGSGPFGPSGGAPAPGGTDTNSVVNEILRLVRLMAARMGVV